MEPNISGVLWLIKDKMEQRQEWPADYCIPGLDWSNIIEECKECRITFTKEVRP